jgi:hypothetical protein
MAELFERESLIVREPFTKEYQRRVGNLLFSPCLLPLYEGLSAADVAGQQQDTDGQRR